MSLQNQFIEFEGKIRITRIDIRLKKIRDKDEEIREEIRDKFKGNGYPVQEFFLQGSYATRTTIIPVDGEDYDIDVAVVINADNAPEDATESKKALRDILVSRNLKEPKIKMPCVTAQYYKSGEKNFHLDYPIYKKDSSNNYYLAVGKEHSSNDIKKWEESEPKELIEWINNSSDFKSKEASEQYKRIIKYIKKWRNYVFTGTERKHIYSIGLVVMIKESFEESISDDGDISDIISLKNTVNNILNKSYFEIDSYDNNGKPKYNIIVNLPKQPYRDIFGKHGIGVGTLLRNKLEKLKENLELVIEKDSLKTQCEILAEKVFGEEFPVPKDDNSKNKKFNESGFVTSPQGAL